MFERIKWRRGGDLNPRGITPTRCPDDIERFSSLAPYRAELPLQPFDGNGQGPGVGLIERSYIAVYDLSEVSSLIGVVVFHIQKIVVEVLIILDIKVRVVILLILVIFELLIR